MNLVHFDLNEVERLRVRWQLFAGHSKSVAVKESVTQNLDSASFQIFCGSSWVLILRLHVPFIGPQFRIWFPHYNITDYANLTIPLNALFACSVHLLIQIHTNTSMQLIRVAWFEALACVRGVSISSCRCMWVTAACVAHNFGVESCESMACRARVCV